MRVLLVVLWVATALAASVAAGAHAERIERRWLRRTVVLAVAGVPFALGAWWTGLNLWLRFSFGDAHAPAALALGGLALHAAGLALLARAAGRSSWSPAALPWSAGALVGMALTVLLFAQLELRAQLLGAGLRLEAGELAHELLPPPPEPEDDAWLRYVELAPRLEAALDFDAWLCDRDALRDGERLDFDDPARRARLEQARPILAEAREAAALPDCDFAGRRRREELRWTEATASPLPALLLAQAWHFEGTARAWGGDVDGAIDDLEALLRLSDQAVGSPLFLDLMAALACRRWALELLEQVLPRADAHQRARLRPLLPRPLAASAARALDMELAWLLSNAGAITGWGDAQVGFPWSPSRLSSGVYLIFHFEQDVAGYRAAVAECRALSAGPLDELQSHLRRSQADRDARRFSSGPIAAYLVSNLGSMLLQLRRADATFELARRALEALAGDRESALAQAAWTDDDPAWGDDAPVFTLGGPR